MSGGRRSSVRETAARGFLSASRFTVSKFDDSTLLQSLSVKGMHGEAMDGIEHMHPYGFTTVAQNGDDNGQPEGIGSQVGENRSHVVVHGISDRRFRPNNLKGGEVAIHDDQGQQVYHSRDMSIWNSPKKVHAQVNDNMHMVMDKEGKTVTVQYDGDKSSRFLLANDSAVMHYDNLSVTIKGGKVMLGNGSAANGVVTQNGVSSKIFAVLTETDTAPTKLTKATIATRTKKQQGGGSSSGSGSSGGTASS